MPKIRCPYCHEYIDEDDFDRHERKHRKLRSDGQQTDYVTLPEDEQEDGDIDDVPTVYKHKKCRTETVMPEEIVRSYLKNPWLYMADETYCCGCSTHVPFRECKWTETGQNLQEYMDDLRAAKPEMKPKGCMAPAAILLALGMAATAWMMV